MPNGMPAFRAACMTEAQSSSTSGVLANVVHCLASAFICSPGFSIEKAMSFGPTKAASMPGTESSSPALAAARASSIWTMSAVCESGLAM